MLKSPTALAPPLSGLAQTSSGPSAFTRSPWRPSGSWSMAITSRLVRIDRVSGLILLRSLPASSGAARIAHRLIWVRYSSGFMPPLPTSSMSGSFQFPGLANFDRPA